MERRKICGCGEIGRRTRLRIWRREAWGFESLHPHEAVPSSQRAKSHRRIDGYSFRRIAVFLLQALLAYGSAIARFHAEISYFWALA